MGTNKLNRKKKTDAIFKVAGHNSLKAKGRIKPVKTNLKKINMKTREQVDKLDEKLKQIQELVIVVKKPSIVENDCEMKVDDKTSCSTWTKPEISIKESIDKLTDLQNTLQIK